ncbi:MAG: adenylyltransferase/cytidyltransferase family protein, partial [Acidobacteriota bacterium]
MPNTQSNKRVAIIGGTFDPFHVGHQKVAQDIKDELGVDEVVFVPANVSPHKLETPPLASGQQRYDMIKAATADIPGSPAHAGVASAS